MRICPKCGYEEFAYWRQNRWRTNVDFCPLQEFRFNYPDLSRDLEAAKDHKYIIQDAWYAYRLSGKYNHIVERVVLHEYDSFGIGTFHVPTEHVEHRKELLEVL